MRDMQRLDQYITVKILGEGSFGKVKLATHQPSGRQVALKIIPKKKVKGNEATVWGEMEVLKGLDHPNIVGIHSDDSDGRAKIGLHFSGEVL